MRNIRHCGDGNEALRLLRHRVSDFLIAGGRMAPMDGLTLIRKLRDPNVTPAPGIPIIYCSRDVDAQTLKQVRGAGVNEVVLKPITADAIRTKVVAVLERPRPVITLTSYIGPDRRRLPQDWAGEERRDGEEDVFI